MFERSIEAIRQIRQEIIVNAFDKAWDFLR